MSATPQQIAALKRAIPHLADAYLVRVTKRVMRESERIHEIELLTAMLEALERPNPIAAPTRSAFDNTF